MSNAANSPESERLQTSPVQVADGVYWVGKRPPKQIFYANPYLVYETKPGTNERFSLLIDPGSGSDFAIVRAKCESVMGSLSDLDAVFINHQDPDVCSSITLLLGRSAPNARVLASEDTWRLVQSLSVPREKFVDCDDYPHGFRGRTGRVLVPVPSQFCHFVGARMIYDRKSRTLFSGDLFGSLTAREAEGLFADESDWLGMRAFHQIYMPTNRALQLAIQRIKALDPPVEQICPQHGRILRGPWVKEFMDRLEFLDVGLDILEARDDTNADLAAWQTVFDRVLAVARDLHGPAAEVMLLEDKPLANYLNYSGTHLRIEHTGKKAVERAISVLVRNAPGEIADPLKYEALTAAHELELPSPQIELEEDGGGGTTTRPKSSPFETL